MEELNKDILIFYDNSIEFFRTHFTNKGFRAVSIYRKSTIFSKVIKVILRYFKLSQAYWYDDWKKGLSSIKTVIFFAPQKRTCAVRYIKKANKNIRIIYWYWNPAFRSGLPSSDLSNKAELWSFDPDDCLKYNMRFNTTFFFDDILLPNNTIKTLPINTNNGAPGGCGTCTLKALLTNSPQSQRLPPASLVNI